ncbi:hypothetical protein PYCC9005_002079 [Savitreella phatthalungensis]
MRRDRISAAQDIITKHSDLVEDRRAGADVIIHGSSASGRQEDGSYLPLLTVIDENKLEVVARLFELGHHVKRDIADPLSGTVTDIETTLVVRNLVTERTRRVSSKEVIKAREWYMDAIVCCGDWIGVIEEVEDEATFMFADDGSVIITDGVKILDSLACNLVYERWAHADDTLVPGGVCLFDEKMAASKNTINLKTSSTRVLRPPPQDVAQIDRIKIDCPGKPTFRRGRLLHLEATALHVSWLYHRMTSSQSVSKQPPMRIPSRATKTSSSGPTLDDVAVFISSMDSTAFDIGEAIRFKDTPRLPVKEFRKRCTSMTESPLRLIDEWRVEQVDQEMKVHWQDGSYSRHISTDLVPYVNIDEFDVWPADPVEHKMSGRRGVVQSVSPADRIANIRWEVAETVRPDSPTGTLEATGQESTVYDLIPLQDLEVDFNDFVLIMDDEQAAQAVTSDLQRAAPTSAIAAQITRTASQLLANLRDSVLQQAVSGTTAPSAIEIADSNPSSSGSLAAEHSLLSTRWFGQILSLDEDGMCRVLLGFERPQAAVVTLPPYRLVRVDLDHLGHHHHHDHDHLDGDMMSLDAAPLDLENSEDLPWTDEQGAIADDNSDWESADGDAIEEHDEEAMVDAAVQNTALTAPLELETQAEAVPAPLSARPISRGDLPSDPDHFAPFTILDTDPPAEHHYITSPAATQGSGNLKRINKEYAILGASLPSGILVRTWETRLDLLRVMIIGPPGTPYEYAPMLFDVHLPGDFGPRPPAVFFHSWMAGTGRINPNLYEDGKVCLSLLGTWQGSSASEHWTTKSSLLQVFISIQSLILVREPYFNEPGYENLRDTEHGRLHSLQYSERAYLLTRDFVANSIEMAASSFASEIRWLYVGPPSILSKVIRRALQTVERSNQPSDSTHAKEKDKVDDEHFKITVSRGGLQMLTRSISRLQTIAAVHAPHPPAA